MAEILIKGMDMLPEGCAYDVRIRGNGDVVDRLTGRVMGHAIEVPTPHGRLINAYKLACAVAEAQEKVLGKDYDPFMLLGDVLRWIELADTVVEASK